MRQEIEENERDADLVEDAALIRMMGFAVLEALPSRTVPYEQVDPFILVHEGRLRALGGRQGRHRASPPGVRQPLVRDRRLGQHRPQHRSGRSDRAGAPVRGRAPGAQDRARRLACRGDRRRRDQRGPRRHEFRGVLFWVNLARKDKQVEPSAQVLQPDEIPVRHEGDAIVRTLVGEGSPVELGTPALILDVELPDGGQVTLAGAARVPGVRLPARGRSRVRRQRRRRSRPARRVLGPGEALTVTDAAPGTRFLLMAGSPTARHPCSTGRTWTSRRSRFKGRIAGAS